MVFYERLKTHYRRINENFSSVVHYRDFCQEVFKETPLHNKCVELFVGHCYNATVSEGYLATSDIAINNFVLSRNFILLSLMPFFER